MHLVGSIRLVALIVLLCSICVERSAAAPEFLEDRFELPPGFRIYRAAGPELSGGSYALTFDGEGRLLVGDGNALRRLVDRDSDGVFDSYDVIATGLGWRGPQGLLVYGDKLFAVGGDGIQLFEGYRSGGPLVHRGRIGNKFSTGGDHDAHMLLRGHDGYIYFMAGNGAGIEKRKHITELSSPCLEEREASVFRISPDGKQWECIGSGGRNPPSLGMNYLGELFSFDSDMEWHVGLPWYRPVRLNHWITGGDQGWQEVGAYPPYFIDCLPGVLNVGRGSPTWGRFYEHAQFPVKYHNAFVVCDYRWKKESNDQYSTTGRLVAFFLTRDGAGWKAAMETLARPKPNARDADGKLISFALVDVEVAPDGSLFITDHNQGIWRLFYDPEKRGPQPLQPPWIGGLIQSQNRNEPDRLLEQLLALPQPGAEWSRLQEEHLIQALGTNFPRLQEMAASANSPIELRLRALRGLAPAFKTLPARFIMKLAADPQPEIRGQAASLIGLRNKQEGPDLVGAVNETTRLVRLLRDEDPFVRRRAAEAFTRVQRPPSEEIAAALVERLGDTNRLIAYTAMMALAHRSRSEWLWTPAAVRDILKAPPAARLRALVICNTRGNLEGFADIVKSLLESLLNERIESPEIQLDLMRVIGLFQNTLKSDPILKQRLMEYLRAGLPDTNRDIRWEQVRLCGEYGIADAFPKLLSLLETERDEVTQFHIAQAIAKLPSGWTAPEDERLLAWFLSKQRGWFTEFAGKGVEFPDFWLTVQSEFGKHHQSALLRDLPKIDFAGQLGSVIIGLLAEQPQGDQAVLALYRQQKDSEARLRIIRTLKRIQTPVVTAFLREEWKEAINDNLRGAIIESLAAQPPDPASLPVLLEGLKHPDPRIVRTDLEALPAFELKPTEPLAHLVISQMTENRGIFKPAYKILVALSHAEPLDFEVVTDPNARITEEMRTEAIKFWTNWYTGEFKQVFASVSARATVEKTDDDLHRFLLNDSFQGGNAGNGGKIYEAIGCTSCHGGGVTPGREGHIFGPDLAGVSRRLSRAELADAIVYPSKQVPDRFKAFDIELKDATPLTGFITEQNDEAVTVVDREQVHRIARSQIRAITPQSLSLMPANLINRLSWEEIRDLMAFVNEGSNAAK